jgi:GntR family transcriptional regulator / MocR family aminotransferase
MHLLLRLAGRILDVRLAKFARADGFAAEPSSMRISRGCGRGPIVDFTDVVQTDAPEIASRLRGAIESPSKVD